MALKLSELYSVLSNFVMSCLAEWINRNTKTMSWCFDLSYLIPKKLPPIQPLRYFSLREEVSKTWSNLRAITGSDEGINKPQRLLPSLSSQSGKQ